VGYGWLTKPRVTASPSPSKEEMYLAGYGILGVGEREGGRNQA